MEILHVVVLIEKKFKTWHKTCIHGTRHVFIRRDLFLFDVLTKFMKAGKNIFVSLPLF